jgi:chitinase
VSTYPTSAVHVHDVGTGADRSIALTQPPISLSLRPDGMSASVAHEGLVTIVNLAPGGAAPKLLATATPGRTVMGGNGYVYVMPSTNGHFRSINIATGVETQNSGADTVGAYTTARLHPAGSKMYGYDTIRGELTSFPIVLGIAQYGDDSSYLPNDHPMCGDQWFNESGTRIYTPCGNTFSTSDIAAQDMLYVGTLALADAANFTYRIDALSESAETQEIALVEYTRDPCTPGQGSWYEVCTSHLSLYDSSSLARDASYSFSPLSIGGRSYAQQGRFVFHSADGTQRYLLTQLLGMPNAGTEFYISRLQ